MKKFLLSIVVVFTFVVMVNAQSTQTYNFSATVAQYIEVNPINATVDIAATTSFPLVIDPATDGSAVIPEYPHWRAMFTDNVYANCPFSISYDGDPILSRKEVNGNGMDRLQTALVIANMINKGAAGYERVVMHYNSEAEGSSNGTYKWNSQTVTFENAPHDGEVQTDIWLGAALPHVTPEFGVDNTWNQSADAGTYTGQIVATYAVTPW